MRLSDDNSELMRVDWSLFPFGAFSHSVGHQFEIFFARKKAQVLERAA
jgi:hypothetical protein